MCGIALVTEMCRVNPETLSHFRRVSLECLWNDNCVMALQVSTCRQTMKPQTNQPTAFHDKSCYF